MAEFPMDSSPPIEDIEFLVSDEIPIIEDCSMSYRENKENGPPLLVGVENDRSNKIPLEQTNSSTSQVPLGDENSLPGGNLSSTSRVGSKPQDNFMYKDTELFHFLNSSLQGRIILGKYKLTRVLDYTKLKDLLIFDKIIEDPIFYKIPTEQFNKLRAEIEELFGFENPDCFFKSYSDNKDKEVVGARGCLYNYYKVVRKELRDAGILIRSSSGNLESSLLDEDIDDDIPTTPKFLTDENRKPYTLLQITKAWDETHEKRKQLLLQEQKKKRIVSLELYSRTYSCLNHPLGSILLAQDFNRLILDLANGDPDPPLIDKTLDYSSLFCTKWVILASKIVSYCKKKKTAEIREFVTSHKTLIDAGSHNSILALFLLPLCLKVVKKIKLDKDTSVSLTKKDVAKSFIVHAEDSEKLFSEQEAFKRKLAELKQEIPPYLLFCGKLESLKAYVILNEARYACDDPLTAVESCYKCLMALHVFPPVSETVWLFMHRAVYNLPSEKFNQDIEKFITNLHKE